VIREGAARARPITREIAPGKAPSASRCAAGRSFSLEEIVRAQEEMQSLAERLAGPVPAKR
jgi:hypothetical protein